MYSLKTRFVTHKYETGYFKNSISINEVQYFFVDDYIDGN